MADTFVKFWNNFVFERRYLGRIKEPRGSTVNSEKEKRRRVQQDTLVLPKPVRALDARNRRQSLPKVKYPPVLPSAEIELNPIWLKTRL